MPKRKSPRSLQPTASATISSSSIVEGETCPSPRLRSIVSLLVVAHLATVLIALAANLAPSLLLGKMTQLTSAYAGTTNQIYTGLPLELTHAEPFDFPLNVEMQSSELTGTEWQAMPLPGIEQPRTDSHQLRFSRWSNFSRVMRMVATNQPDSEILADIAARLVELAEKREQQTFQGIRFIAPKVLSYDEDALLASGQSTKHDEELLSTIVYSATILRDVDGRLSLVPQQIPLRTAKPLLRERESRP